MEKILTGLPMVKSIQFNQQFRAKGQEKQKQKSL